MINNRFPTVCGVLVVLAALATAAFKGAMAAPAHIPEVPPVASPGNTAEAEAILGAKLLVCNTCHGANGAPRSGVTPIIWGLQENYLAKQLHDFQAGARGNDVMEWMATALTPAELTAAAAAFSKGAGRRELPLSLPRRHPLGLLYAKFAINRILSAACQDHGWLAKPTTIWSRRCVDLPKGNG